MSIYLSLAEQVLRNERRPMTAIQILRGIYAQELAPWHLHGRTQHKTLQARLSEDILKRRDRSRFYRTAPGRFFLREFILDESIAEKDRKPIIARRRRRDLPVRRTLALARPKKDESHDAGHRVSASSVISCLEAGQFHYVQSPSSADKDDLVIWTAALVIRSSFILTYRVGRYRENRDAFAEKRSIGFYTPVIEDDLTLFNRPSFGIVGSGIRALSMDLDIHDARVVKLLYDRTYLDSFIYPDETTSGSTLLALVTFDCPADIEPTSSRLAINDLEWMDLRSSPNDMDDFDPWSKLVLTEARRIAECLS